MKHIDLDKIRPQYYRVSRRLTPLTLAVLNAVATDPRANLVSIIGKVGEPLVVVKAVLQHLQDIGYVFVEKTQ